MHTRKLKLAAAICTVLAAGGNCGAWAADVDWALGSGWSLVGNPFSTALPVGSVFGTKEAPKSGVTDNVLTVWQWDAAKARWQFFTPTLTADELASYVASKNYDLLTELSPGAGAWVNLKAAQSPSLRISGKPMTRNIDDLPSAWSLNILATTTKVDDFNRSSRIVPSGSTSEIPENFTTLWAWNAAKGQWVFYAPSLQRQGLAQLAEYTTKQKYLDFVNGSIALDEKTGFWVNRPAIERSQPRAVFPISLAIASPTAISQTPTAGANPVSRAIAPAATAEPPSSFEAATAQVSSLISSSANSATVQQAAQQFMALLQGMIGNNGNAACFGPAMDYKNHPNATNSLTANGQLPSGDLGLWKDKDGNGVACAAAELDARLIGTAARANGALGAMAALLGTAYKKAGALPTAGTSVDVTSELNTLLSTNGITGATVNSAIIKRDSAGTTWEYALDIGFSVTVSGVPISLQLSSTLAHSLGAAPAQGNGLLKYALKMPSASCLPSTSSTLIGSVKYAQGGSAALQTNVREGEYCGSYTLSSAPTTTWDSTGQASASGPWSNNFSRFAGDFSPLTRGGNYLFAWQAGTNDLNARIFAMSVDGSARTGDAWYGFGEAIQTTTGNINGFLCNWAGPNASRSVLTKYAQRQKIAFNATSYKWEPSASQLRYAPVNTCQYDGTKTFWYDRNIDAVNNETSAELTVSGAESDFLYLSPGGNVASDISSSGYVKPAGF